MSQVGTNSTELPQDVQIARLRLEWRVGKGTASKRAGLFVAWLLFRSKKWGTSQKMLSFQHPQVDPTQENLKVCKTSVDKLGWWTGVARTGWHSDLLRDGVVFYKASCTKSGGSVALDGVWMVRKERISPANQTADSL
jgi:hypothetical protein